MPVLSLWVNATNLRAIRTRVLDFDGGKDLPFLAPWAPLLVHLASRAELLEHHFGVAAAVGIGVVEAHAKQAGMLHACGSKFCGWWQRCQRSCLGPGDG